MNIRILSPSKVLDLAYQKVKKAFDAFTTKSRHFAEEQKAQGEITNLGFHSKYIKKPVGAAFAFFGNFSTAMSFVVINEIVQDAAEKTLSAIKAMGLYAAASAIKPEETLTQNFTDQATEFVSKDIYDALHNQDAVLEFEKKMARVREETDPNFIGPLTGEFEAHTRLAQSGIQYIREGNQSAFIFPERMLSDMRQQFGTASEQENNASYHVLVFRECAAPQRSEHRYQPAGFQKDMEPQMVPVPKGEARTYVPQ